MPSQYNYTLLMQEVVYWFFFFSPSPRILPHKRMAYGTRKRKPSDVLQSHHHQICLILSTTDAILLPFTAKLFEKHIIDRSTKNEISHNLGYKAADTLLDCLEMKVDVNSSLLQTVFQVMREVDTLKDVVEQMKKERLAKQEDIQDIPLPGISMCECICV